MAQSEPHQGPIRALVFLALAVVASGAAIFVLFQLVDSYQSRVQSADQLVQSSYAIVAQRDLFPGLTITEDDVVLLEIPDDVVPINGFANPQEVVGRIPRERILANEFVRRERLADKNLGTGLNALISQGSRAISIDIDDGRGLSGFLNPGNYVDVLVTIVPDTKDEPPETRTILQTLQVLAVRGRLVRDHTDLSAPGALPGAEGEPAPPPQRTAQRRQSVAPSVTLQVTPDQAEQIAHADAKGTITLVLRNDLDLQEHPTDGVTIAEIIEKEDVVQVRHARPPEPPKQTLLIYKGTDAREYEYQISP